MTVRLSLNFGRGRAPLHPGAGVLPTEDDDSTPPPDVPSRHRHTFNVGGFGSGGGGGVGRAALAARPEPRKSADGESWGGEDDDEEAQHSPSQSRSQPRPQSEPNDGDCSAGESATEREPPPLHEEGEDPRHARPAPPQRQSCNNDDDDDDDDPKSKCARIDELEDEVRRLKESTKLALRHSWDENENLGRRARSAERRADKLERKLERSRTREEHWRAKCEKLWHRLMNESGGHLDFKLDDEAPEEHSDEEENVGAKQNRHTFLGGLRRASMDMIRGNGERGAHHNDPQQQQQQQQQQQAAMDAVVSQLRESQQALADQSNLVTKQNAQIDDLESRLSARDEVVQTLEQTAQAQGRALGALRSQMQCMKDEGVERESKLGREICELKKKIHEKKSVILQQAKKYEEAQGYIEEVTKELQKVYDEREGRTATSKAAAAPVITL